jgi:hypothetical protein
VCDGDGLAVADRNEFRGGMRRRINTVIRCHVRGCARVHGGCSVNLEESGQCTGVVRGAADSQRTIGGRHAADSRRAAVGGHGR